MASVKEERIICLMRAQKEEKKRNWYYAKLFSSSFYLSTLSRCNHVKLENEKTSKATVIWKEIKLRNNEMRFITWSVFGTAPYFPLKPTFTFVDVKVIIFFVAFSQPLQRMINEWKILWLNMNKIHPLGFLLYRWQCK